MEPKQILIRISESDLARIDTHAKNERRSRQGFILHAIDQYLAASRENGRKGGRPRAKPEEFDITSEWHNGERVWTATPKRPRKGKK